MIKLAGQDITQSVGHLSVELRMGHHSHFTLHKLTNERSTFFIDSLSKTSEELMGQLLEVEGIFTGIVTAVSLSRVHTEASEFVIRGQSPTIRLDDGIHTRSFGAKKLKQIVHTVFQPYEEHFEKPVIEPAYGDIKYCVQYRESNFAFMNRLAARYGEWFFYDGLKLVFGKKPKSNTILLTFPTHIPSFNISMKTVPVNFKLKMYDYKSHEFPQKEAEYAALTNPFAKIALDKSKNTVYPKTPSVPINIGMSQDDLEHVKTLRQNVRVNEMVVLRGSTQEKGLKLGSFIKVSDERLGLIAAGMDDYGEYIITQISHEFSTNGEGYSNHFEAIPKDAVIPPMICSPDPPACESQQAKIMENNDPDSLGRVRVQFFWQEGAEEGNDRTNWIRVASHSGGGDRGLYILPEIDDAVLIAFEHDHPERAYVLTSMYHAKSKPEHHDAGNMKKALKTKGGHQILMNDTKGSETMAFFSPTDITSEAKAGKMDSTAKTTIKITSLTDTINITTPAKISIESTAADMLLRTKTNIWIDATGNIEIHATQNIKVTAEGTMDVKSVGAMTITAASLDIKADDFIKMSAKDITIDGSATATVKGGDTLSASSKAVTISGTDSLSASSKATTISGSKTLDASGNAVTITGDTSSKVSGGKLDLESQGITSVSGSMVKIN
jgi:type VI secretion system secreted protein VgrG